MSEEGEHEEKRFMVRDSDQTKYHLWNAYEGYEEHYGNYMMYERTGLAPPTIIAGLYKYIIKFYYQIKNKWEDFNGKEITKEKVEQYKKIMEKQQLEKKDYTFIMEFIEDFMSASGVKNIIFSEDDPGQGVKKNR